MNTEPSSESALLTHHELQLQNNFLSALSDVTVDLLNQSHLSDLLSNIVERLIRLSGGCFAYIAVEHESGGYVSPTTVSTKISGNQKINKIFPNDGIGGTAWAENRDISITDYQSYGNRKSSFKGFVQANAIPLPKIAGIGGVLCVFYDNADVDIESQIDVLKKFGVIANAALQNARLHEKRRLELSMFEAMLEINQTIYESSKSYDIIESVCEMIVTGFNANWAKVYRYSDGQFLELPSLTNKGNRSLSTAFPTKRLLDESAHSWSIINHESVLIESDVDDERESSHVHAHRKTNNVGSSYFVPIISNEEAWGILAVHKKIGELDFTPIERQLIDLLTSQLSIAINRQRLLLDIEFQANHDKLTGCFSRSGFEKILKERVELASLSSEELTVLYIDLDGFKSINETLGHETGDQVLIGLVSKINELLNDHGCVARLGGDEFAVLPPIDFSHKKIQALGLSISNCMSLFEGEHGLSVKVGASVGFASYPKHADTAEELLRCADIALHHAKGTGTGLVHQYDPEFGKIYRRKLTLKSRIEKALSNNEFELHYQPKVSALDGQVTGAEALIRWNEPEFSAISPAEWIPLAEETGDIHQIGDWVTRESLRYLKELRAQGHHLKLSINISATQFDSPDFPKTALDHLQDSGIEGSAIEFEITETAVIADTEVAVAKLNQIRAHGISIAIDDFGVKYSSLAYLGDLPIDVLKIDRVFVQRMDTGAGRSMIQPIVVLAQSLGLETVVEGIETKEQLQKVSAIGCDSIQGYYYSKPVPGNELPAVISRINSASTSEINKEAA